MKIEIIELQFIFEYFHKFFTFAFVPVLEPSPLFCKFSSYISPSPHSISLFLLFLIYHIAQSTTLHYYL